MKRVLIVSLLAGLIGCGDVASPRSAARIKGELESLAPASASVLNEDADLAGAGQLAAPAESPAQPTANRKIIYRAEIELVVEDFTTVESAAPRLVAEHGGYLADMQLSRNSGDNRSGRWIARVPVGRFDAFLDAASSLGVPVRRQQTGEDVTVEFFDLEARLVAKQKFETRLLALLDDRTDGVKDLIEVEKELARVRSEIERMQGRRRYLVNQTTFTTVTLTAREQRDYQPPEAPGLGGRLAAAWSGSVGAIGDVATALMIGAVGATPWVLMVGSVIGPAWWWRKNRHSTPSEHDSVLADE